MNQNNETMLCCGLVDLWTCGFVDLGAMVVHINDVLSPTHITVHCPA